MDYHRVRICSCPPSKYELKCNLGSEAVMTMIGVEIAKMHAADVIHGDLTTSNMMLRKVPPAAELVRFPGYPTIVGFSDLGSSSIL